MSLCECCDENPVKYKLKNTSEANCEHCGYLKYKEGSVELNLCDLECDGLYWWVLENKTKKNSKNVSINYCLEKDECSKCGRRDFPVLNFTGTII